MDYRVIDYWTPPVLQEEIFKPCSLISPSAGICSTSRTHPEQWLHPWWTGWSLGGRACLWPVALRLKCLSDSSGVTGFTASVCSDAASPHPQGDARTLPTPPSGQTDEGSPRFFSLSWFHQNEFDKDDSFCALEKRRGNNSYTSKLVEIFTRSPEK